MQALEALEDLKAVEASEALENFHWVNSKCAGVKFSTFRAFELQSFSAFAVVHVLELGRREGLGALESLNALIWRKAQNYRRVCDAQKQMSQRVQD